jgi:hypothetical protein
VYTGIAQIRDGDNSSSSRLRASAIRETTTTTVKKIVER